MPFYLYLSKLYMKKLICLLLVTHSLESVKAQVVPPTVAKPELWQTSRKLRRVGFFLLGTGVATTLFGVGTAYAEALNGFWGGTPKPSSATTITAAGLIMIAGSIPVFIIGSKKKRASLSFSQPSNFF